MSRSRSPSQTKWGICGTNIDFPGLTFPLWREFERPLRRLDWWLDPLTPLVVAPIRYGVLKSPAQLSGTGFRARHLFWNIFGCNAVIVGTLTLCRGPFKYVGC
jgi:hypothetical protein